MRIAGGAYAPTVFVEVYATQGPYNVRRLAQTSV
jgi:hypothetical protein